MTAADKAAIMHLLRNTPEFLPHEVIVAEELIDVFLTDPAAGYHILVADSGGQVHGYVCYGQTPLTDGAWDIYWVAVDRTLQGKGIGKALMAAAHDDIRQTHGRLAVIETSSKPDYNKTRRFHEAVGYREVARIPDFYAVGDDLVIMVKRFQQS